MIVDLCRVSGVAIYLVIICLISCCAWQGRIVIVNPTLENRVITGDAAFTYHDVTVLTCAQRCASTLLCGFYAYNADKRQCVFCSLCGNMSLEAMTGYQLFTLTADSAEPSYDEPNVCTSSTAVPHACWKHSEGHLTHVSVGPAGVWGVNHYQHIYYKKDTYQDPEGFGSGEASGWHRAFGWLTQIDVGTDIVWGVKEVFNIYHRDAITSSMPSGSDWSYFDAPPVIFTWVSVSPGGSVWAVSTAGNLLHRRSSSNAQPVGTAWDVMDTDVQRVDAGQAGVWALKTDGRLFYRHGTYGDNGSTGTDWRSVEGTFTSVSSGKNVVVVVDTAGHVWVRSGVSSDTPAGLAWVRYPGYMKLVDVYQTDQVLAMWGLDFNEQIYFSLM